MRFTVAFVITSETMIFFSVFFKPNKSYNLPAELSDCAAAVICATLISGLHREQDLQLQISRI